MQQCVLHMRKKKGREGRIDVGPVEVLGEVWPAEVLVGLDQALVASPEHEPLSSHCSAKGLLYLVQQFDGERDADLNRRTVFSFQLDLDSSVGLKHGRSLPQRKTEGNAPGLSLPPYEA